MTTSPTPSIEFQPFRLPRMGLGATGAITFVRDEGRLELRSTPPRWIGPKVQAAILVVTVVPLLVVVVSVTPLWIGLPAVLFGAIYGGLIPWAAAKINGQSTGDFVIELPAEPVVPAVVRDGTEQMLHVTSVRAECVHSRVTRHWATVHIWWRLQLRCGEHVIHVIDRAGRLDRVAGAIAHAWQLPVEVESIKVRDGGGAYDWSTAPYTTLKLERRLKSADGVVRYRPVAVTARASA